MAMGIVMSPSIMNSHLQPLRPFAPLSEEWMAVCRKPPNMVPARPEEVKIPLRLPSSRAVYQDPRM